MRPILDFIHQFYTIYTMLLVIGCGLMVYFVDYKDMEKKNNKKEAGISKFIGLAYIIGSIALYALVFFTN